MLSTPPKYIPRPEELLEYLKKPPVEPIEIHPVNYNRYFQPELSSDILQKMFVKSNKAAYRVWTEFITNIACPPDVSNQFTEDSFHAFWDMVIVKPFKIGYPDGHCNRNTSLHIPIKNLQPDFAYLVENVCLVRGEEKGIIDTGDPAKELINKLEWTYGKCPYIFGYYAYTTKVTYCYIYAEGKKILRKDLFTLNLDTMRGRVEAFNIGINIGRLLPLLRQTVPYDYKEYIILFRSDGRAIELMQNKIVKRYHSIEAVEHIQTIYRELSNQKVPFVDKLEHANFKDTSAPFVIFSPKGVLCEPQSRAELIKALYCVLSALKVPIVFISFILEKKRYFITKCIFSGDSQNRDYASRYSLGKCD